ncbi:MAG: hypothetical protein IPI32_01560 [Austwickia sp.]|nr:hypothetical protein [Austwickia sp.]MBK8437648.1 hypothetical protein [Austwickia sp.]MBK9102904.1 hypothetical protein [Austwickia sp.]
MSAGFGIFLIAVGAILSFAVQDRVSGVDLRMIGYILMGAGLVTLLLSLFLSQRRQTTVTARRDIVTPDGGRQSVVEQEHPPLNPGDPRV